MQIVPFGDRAALVNFKQEVSHEVSQRVYGLQAALQKTYFAGIMYITPAYCSLTIGYDPRYAKYDELEQHILTQANNLDWAEVKSRTLQWPVCFDKEYALDLEEIAKVVGLSVSQVIEKFTQNHYRVFMIGFVPGFTYLGSVESILQLPRKTNPMLEVPARSVAIAGAQAGIYPTNSPGGWHILGSTPINPLTPFSDNLCLFKSGDRVKFHQVNKEEYMTIRHAIERQDFDLNQLLDAW